MSDAPGGRTAIVPRATYRLQLRGEFTFDDAAAVTAQLAELGVSHVYTSPYLQATEGSTHGYDVVDHGAVAGQLGGTPARERFVAALAAHGLGHVVDVVPNHMAVAPGNRWFRDVLEHGPASRFASYFDVDWDPPESWLRNRVLQPVLDDHYGRVLEAGRIRVEREDAAFRIVVDDALHFPVAPRSLPDVLAVAADAVASEDLGFLARSYRRLPPAWVTESARRAERSRDVAVLHRQLARLLSDDPRLAPAIDDALVALAEDPERLHGFLEQQNFRLAHWRNASQELDYRRFFDIDSLIGLRVEDPEVFAAAHELVLRWVAEGTVDGLRIDHPDGLLDPGDYLRRLRRAAPDAWIVVEKILEPEEELRRTWPVDGTTGYDFLAEMTRLHTDTAGQAPLVSLEHELTGDDRSWEEVVEASKRRVIAESLAVDLNRLTGLLAGVAESRWQHRDLTRTDLRAAVLETLVAFGVYRTYVGQEGDQEPVDRAEVQAAVATAAARRPDVDPLAFELLTAILLAELPGAAETQLRMRFQQLTGPVMAKGTEDTACYRRVPLASLAEVGSDPVHWSTSPEEFHASCRRRHEHWPLAMLSLSTHDTKRSEDVRARLSLISEIPGPWALAVRSWWRRADRHRSGAAPEPALEYLLYQSIVGAHPVGTDRLLAFAEKASREAKTATSWRSPDPAYDEAVRRFVEGIAGDDELQAEIASFVRPLVAPGRVVSLSQKLVQLTAPGVPDVYQGTELWDLSLVDPDNRRPVDHELRRRLLEELRSGLSVEEVLGRSDEGLPKLLVTARALATRRAHLAAFGSGPAGAYSPLRADGPAAEHLVGFTRGEDVAVLAPRLVLGLERRGGWAGTQVVLPPGRWEDVMTGERTTGGRQPLGELLARFPVALLVREDA